MPHAPVLTTRHLIVFFVRDFRVFKYKQYVILHVLYVKLPCNIYNQSTGVLVSSHTPFLEQDRY